MGVEMSDVGVMLSLKERLIRKSVAVGDLAVVALSEGGAKHIQLWAIPNRLYIGGRFDFDQTRDVVGHWFVKKKRHVDAIVLSRESVGYWSLGYSYVNVGEENIEVVIDGEPWVSRTNICGMLRRVGGDRYHVVVHIMGTLRAALGRLYTAFRCSEWILPLLPEPIFERFAFDKRNIHNSVSEKPALFWDVFVKEGVIAKVLINPSCEEYVGTVNRLYGVHVRCEQ